MFTKKYSQNEYPLYIYDTKKKKILRHIVDKIIKIKTEKKINQILQNDLMKQILIDKNKNLISLFLRYHYREKIYEKICHYVISDYLNKNVKIENKKLFNISFKDSLKSIYTLIRLFYFIIKPFFIKKKKVKNYDIIVQYIYSNNIKSKQDFPLLQKINNKIKVAHLISNEIPYGTGLNYLNTLKKNYITKYKINSLIQNNIDVLKISKKTLMSFYFLIKKWFVNPYLSSLLIEYFIEYEYYKHLFKTTGAKIYVHSLTYEKNIAPIRQALEDCGGKNIAFQRSYFDSASTSYLQQPDEILFSWGKSIEKNIDKKSNNIKSIIKTYPDYLFNKTGKIKKKKKLFVISFFDTTIHNGGFVSPDDYNKYLDIVLRKVLKKKKIFLIMKYKYNFTNKVISCSNNEMIKELKSQGRCKEFSRAYVNNSSIIRSSNLVLSINSITISSEALFYKVDSLSFCNKGFNDFCLKNLNKIYPFAYKNLNKVDEILENKIEKKLEKHKINKLHQFFFKKDLYSKHPKKFIESILKN